MFGDDLTAPPGGEAVEPSIFVILSFLAFVAVIVSVIVLQILALRHKREHGGAFMLKDSLFKHKHLVYTDEGMRFINLQKQVAIIGMLVIVALLVMERVLV